MKKLTERQAAFAAEYVKTGDAVAAALKAGYTQSSARKPAFLLKNPAVAEQIEKLRAGNDGRITRRQLIEDLLEIKDRCMAAKPVMVRDPDTKERVESGVWEFDVSGAIKAVEKLEKLLSDGDEDKPAESISLAEREAILHRIAAEFSGRESDG